MALPRPTRRWGPQASALPRRTLRAELNALLDHYDEFPPAMGAAGLLDARPYVAADMGLAALGGVGGVLAANEAAKHANIADSLSMDYNDAGDPTMMTPADHARAIRRWRRDIRRSEQRRERELAIRQSRLQAFYRAVRDELERDRLPAQVWGVGDQPEGFANWRAAEADAEIEALYPMGGPRDVAP